MNKEKVFNGNTEILKCNIKNISLEHLVEVIKNTIYKVIIIILLITYNNTQRTPSGPIKTKVIKKNRPLEDLVPAWRNKYIITVFELLPTPPNTLLKYLFTAVLIMVILKNTPSKSLLSV